MRDADGFAFARAIGLQIVLATLPALIFFVAAAVWSGSPTLQSSMEGIVTTLTPGPTSDVLEQAVDQGEDNARRNALAMVFGGITALTSGAVAMARHLGDAFRLRVAWLDGELRGQGRIDLPLRVDLDDRPRQIVDHRHGKSSQTDYQVLGSQQGWTRVRLTPLTGRTHQLRAHCALLGTPILGDRKYGGAAACPAGQATPAGAQRARQCGVARLQRRCDAEEQRR